MRKILGNLAAAVAPAPSQAARYYSRASVNAPAELSAGAAGYRANPVPGEVTAGVVTGTVVGLGALALADGIVQPCRGFHAMLMLNRGACVNGHYVGYGPHRVVRR